MSLNIPVLQTSANIVKAGNRGKQNLSSVASAVIIAAQLSPALAKADISAPLIFANSVADEKAFIQPNQKHILHGSTAADSFASLSGFYYQLAKKQAVPCFSKFNGLAYAAISGTHFFLKQFLLTKSFTMEKVFTSRCSIYFPVVAFLIALGIILPKGAEGQICSPTTASFSNSTPVAISSASAVTVTSTIVVAGAPNYLTDVNATTFITHTNAGNLDITIQSPAGTVVTLTTDNGGTNDNVYNGTLWDDDANPAGQVPYSSNNGLATDNSYANLTLASPLAPEEPLGAFIGENPNGTWTITISDDASSDGGSLNSWSLDLSGLASAPTLSSATNFINNTPVTIPTTGPPNVISSTISVAGLGTQIFDVNLTTFITHSFTSDIDMTLQSPAGTIVTISSDNDGGNDNCFNGTVWDDDANPLGQVPYSTNNNLATDHSYTNLVTATPLAPEEALAAFYGENPNGTWTLTISDDANLDGGSLNSWSLDIVTATCGPAAASDDCAGANFISCGAPIPGSTTSATADAYIDCGAGSTGSDLGVWYKMAGNNSIVTITTCDPATTFDTKLTIYSGTCGALSCVTGNDDMSPACAFASFRSEVTFTALTGTTYYVFVSGFNGATGDFVLNMSCIPLPTNDDCASATAITCASSPVSGSTTFATADTYIDCGAGTNGADIGLWYSFAGNNSHVTMSTCNAGTNFDTKLTIYKGSCGALTCVTGNDDMGASCGFSSFRSQVEFDAFSGTTYYVFVSGFSGATGNFNLDITCASYDNCNGALTISCASSPVSGSTTGATVDASFQDCGSGTDGTENGVWYKYVGNDQSVNVTTCHSTGYDSRLTVYSGSCGAFTCITGNDDMGSTACPSSGARSQVNFNANTGTDYYIFVHGFGSSTGNFILTLTCGTLCTPVPSNETCGAASAATVGATCIPTTVDNHCALPAGDEPPSAPAFGTYPDVWYSFTAPVTGGVDLILTNGTATTLGYAIYPSCGGSSIAGAYNVTSGSTINVTGLTPSATYFLQLYTNTANSGTFDFCLVEPCTPLTWYQDADGDGFGNPGSTTQACTQPGGYVADNSDCDDTQVLYTDADGDGFGSSTQAACGVANNFDCDDANFRYNDGDGDGYGAGAPAFCGVLTNDDCNDANGTIYPGAPELCDNLDNNCDGVGDDADSDTYNGCANDCDDTNPLVNPGATEVCGDGLDNDCSGGDASCAPVNDLCTDAITITCGSSVEGTNINSTPEGIADCNTQTQPGVWYKFTGTGDLVSLSTCVGITNFDTKISVYSGSCGALACVAGNDDGGELGCNAAFSSRVEFLSTLGTDYFILVHGFAGATGNFTLSTTCCPPLTFYADADGDSYGDPAASTLACSVPLGYVADNTDCDDTDGNVHPGATEVCGDGIDNDCAGGDAPCPPANDLCVDAISISCGSATDGTTTNATSDGLGVCGSSNPASAPGVWYKFTGTGDLVTLSTCLGTTNYDTQISVFDGTCGSLSCVAGNDDGSESGCSSFFSSKVEFLSTLGTEYLILVHGFAGATGNFTLTATCCTPSTFYADSDNDGYGDLANTTQACSAPSGYVANSTDCNDADGTVYPGAPEFCDGFDTNCDGNNDDGDGDGYLGCLNDCDDHNAAVNPGATEVCNDIDDDCDGIIDGGFSVTVIVLSNYNEYDVSCNGASDGSAEATFVGGTSPFSYAWDNGETTNPATMLTAGTHSVTVTDGTGCAKVGTVTLTQPTPLTIDAGDNKVVYVGYPDSLCATLTASGIGGGVPPYQLQWSNGSPLYTTTVCPTTTSVYYVTVTDRNGCTAVDSVKVCVIDVRCGNHMEKVAICHQVSDPPTTICVALNAAKVHIRNHSLDQLGACGTLKVCSFTPPSAKGEDDISYFISKEAYEGKTWLAAFPNPFADNTEVRFMLPADDKVTLKVYDVAGKELAELFSGNVTTGIVNGSSFDGSKYSSGVYFLTLINSKGERFVEKLVMTK